MNKAEMRAALLSSGGWGTVGSDKLSPRYSKAFDCGRNKMRLCWQCREAGVRHKADFGGFANGVCLTSGCEFHVAMWVREGRP